MPRGERFGLRAARGLQDALAPGPAEGRAEQGQVRRQEAGHRHRDLVRCLSTQPRLHGITHGRPRARHPLPSSPRLGCPDPSCLYQLDARVHAGLGRATVKHLLRTGEYHVIGAVRDLEKVCALAVTVGLCSGLPGRGA